MLPESLYHDKEVLFMFPSTHSVWRATSVFNMYLEGGVSSEFTSGIFCFEVSQINNTFLIKNCINQYTLPQKFIVVLLQPLPLVMLGLKCLSDLNIFLK